jgi:hypothetical protein
MKTRIYYGKEWEKGHSYIDLELKEKVINRKVLPNGEVETEKGFVFSASGMFNYYYDKYLRGWDYEGGGQCLDTILEAYPKDKQLKEIVRLWKLYHLNDMNAGTPKQQAHLKSLGEHKSYEWACEELMKAGIIYDNGYKYGSEWLFNEIPKQDLKRIKEIIKENS